MATWVALNSLAKGQFADSSGNVLVSRSVNVYLRGTTTFPAGGIAPNADGSGTLLTQPLSTNSSGDVPGYVKSGQSIDFYDVATTTRYQGEALAATGNSIPNIPNWAPNTFYPAQFVVVNAGILWQANADFTSGSSFNAANWTALTAAGTGLFTAKLTGDFASSGSGFQAISGLAVTFVASARPVKIELYAYSIVQNTSAGTPTLYICDNSGNVQQIIQCTVASIGAGGATPSSYGFVEISGLTAGTSYTYKAYISTTAGSATVKAGTTFPAILRAEQT